MNLFQLDILKLKNQMLENAIIVVELVLKKKKIIVYLVLKVIIEN